MAELMMAIVILGLGLLMVATMFPIAWTRARDLAEFTTQSTATQSATTTVQLLCQVSNTTPAVSFRGDDINGDTSVHPLHLGNALAVPVAPDTFTEVGDYFDAATGSMDISIESQPPYSIGTALPTVQVAFHERVIPPLPARPGDSGVGDAQWAAQLANRRFAWSFLHKLDAVPSSLDAAREFTVFVVTLRRTQPTHRFARQDPVFPTTTAQARPPSDDVMLPVPWLVNLKVIGNWDPVSGMPPPNGPRGIPSEAVANPGGSIQGRLIARMLQTGSVLIDRLNGEVFTVENHRYTGSGTDYDHEATVTLDREIKTEDVDTDGDGEVLTGVPAPSEEMRDFWVFPPPVLRTGDDAFPDFDGKQPVVGVDVRSMIFAP